MKKKLLTLLLAFFAIATTAQAQVVLNETNFPDANFRAALAWKLGISEGDEITAEMIAATTELDVSKAYNTPANEKIADLTGIEYFTALTTLDCYHNQLTSLDVSNNTALRELYCVHNQLTSLDVSKNTALTSLSCYDNQLTSLDVSGCTALTSLSCYDNQLTSLDVSKKTALTELYCYRNQIKGKEMDELVANIPTVKSGKFYVINTKDANEGNVCTKSQVTVAKGKGWTVYDYNGNYNAGDLVSYMSSVEYEGSDDPTNIGTSLNDNGQMINDSWYSVDGVKLQGEPTQKGVYIQNGQKVVLK